MGYFGGVHGLERIGAEVVIAFLHSLVMRLQWDSSLHHQLESVRLVFMPIVNPGGMALGTRANPQGVDLMRNSPVQALDPVPFMVGGQRWSARLPWYRGALHAPMEAENQAVCDVVAAEMLHRPFSLSVDCHSGFGTADRIWFPYAHTRAPIAHLAEVHALKTIFAQSHSHHRYIFEPQSLQYLAHGDVWDHLYQQACAAAGPCVFAADAGDGLVVMGQEKPAPIVFAPRHLQSLDRTPPAAGAAPAPAVSGLLAAGGLWPYALVAARAAAVTAPRASPASLVLINLALSQAGHAQGLS